MDLDIILKESGERNGKKYKFHLKGTEFSDRVISVKKKIQDFTGIFPKSQNLFFKGHVLDDDSIVGRLNLKDGSSLRLEVVSHVFEKLSDEVLEKMEEL